MVEKQASLRTSLRRRIRSLYTRYNLGDWERCYLHLDPRLREGSRIELPQYADSLAAFKDRYGNINILYIQINLHLDVKKNKHDDRPFAYAYVIWQDASHTFHVFRERWVNDSGRWYTRVVGLVPYKETTDGQD
jgi:hypothetical protein